tara:strand:- start:48 stop:842 length:795 start_codon:yes stop_codon:yes gene_type:complete
MSDQAVLFERKTAGIAVVTLNRPNVHNAFNDVMIAQLTKCFDEIAKDKKIRVMLLQSKGKSFSAGADLKWMRAAVHHSAKKNEEDAKKLAGLFHRLDTMPMPTVVRVQGPAFAGGLGLVACCDVALGAKGVKFAVTEVKLGLIPAVISPYLAQAIGASAARQFFQTAEVFGANKAKQIGLLHEVVDITYLDSMVNEVVSSILGNAQGSNRACKKLIYEIGSQVSEEFRADTARQIASIRSTVEAQEGIGAFFERRHPQWVEGKQ